MLVENTEPRARSIGSLILIPGYNKIEDSEWDQLIKQPIWKAPIEGLIKQKIITVKDDREKLTMSTVEKTYDIDLLETWLADSDNKGPLRGAIKKQLKAMEIEDTM